MRVEKTMNFRPVWDEPNKGHVILNAEMCYQVLKGGSLITGTSNRQQDLCIITGEQCNCSHQRVDVLLGRQAS